MSTAEHTPLAHQDPAALRRVRELEQVIQARLEEARRSQERVDAARVEAEGLVREAAAEAEIAARRVAEGVIASARREVTALQAQHERRREMLLRRAQERQDDLVDAVLAAVLVPDPVVAGTIDSTAGGHR